MYGPARTHARSAAGTHAGHHRPDVRPARRRATRRQGHLRARRRAGRGGRDHRTRGSRLVRVRRPARGVARRAGAPRAAVSVSAALRRLSVAASDLPGPAAGEGAESARSAAAHRRPGRRRQCCRSSPRHTSSAIAAASRLRTASGRIGFYAAATHDLVAVDHCLLADEPRSTPRSSPLRSWSARSRSHVRRVEIAARGALPGSCAWARWKDASAAPTTTQSLTWLARHTDVAGVVLTARAGGAAGATSASPCLRRTT